MGWKALEMAKQLLSLVDEEGNLPVKILTENGPQDLGSMWEKNGNIIIITKNLAEETGL